MSEQLFEENAADVPVVEVTTAAAEVAREKRAAQFVDEVVVLSTGVRVRVRGVSSGIRQDAYAIVKDPPVPMVEIEDKGTVEENPSDPAYLEAKQEANMQRVQAVHDAMVMFGFDLEDGVPPDGEWLPKLRFLEKRGILDLSKFDLGDPVEREFVYKRYIAVSDSDMQLVNARTTGMTEEALLRVAAMFQRD